MSAREGVNTGLEAEISKQRLTSPLPLPTPEYPRTYEMRSRSQRWQQGGGTSLGSLCEAGRVAGVAMSSIPRSSHWLHQLTSQRAKDMSPGRAEYCVKWVAMARSRLVMPGSSSRNACDIQALSGIARGPLDLAV